jgi:hypothetical protein
MPGDDDKLVRLADVLAALHRAYLDGFNRSAEGYNAEFPFEGDSAENDPFWTDVRDMRVGAILSTIPAATPRPMKDAPRDGTKVLAWWPPTVGPGAWMTTWRETVHDMEAWNCPDCYAYDGDDHAPTRFLPHPPEGGSDD